MRPTSIAEILDMRRIIDVTSNAPRGASRYSEPRMRNRLVVDSRLSHWRLAAALKAIRCSDVWNGVDVRSAVASAHCPGRRGSLPGVIRCPGVICCPGAVRRCTGAFLAGADVGCAVDLGAAPHAASPRKTPPGLEGSKGMRALAGAWGVLCFPRCRGRLSLERAHRQSGEARDPGRMQADTER